MSIGSTRQRTATGRNHPFLRALVEIAGIVFLFYSNLLMGEFNHHSGVQKTLAAALRDIVTRENFAIAIITSTCGYILFELLRQRLDRRKAE